MTREEISELFIQAAEVDRRLPNTARPARIKSMSLPFVHDQKDMNGWGAERYQEERADFFDAKSTRLTKNQVSIWELSMELIKLIPAENQRRALWAWATAKAGGMSLAKWSKTIEHVGPATAQHRAMAGITKIHQYLCSNPDLHNQNDMDQDLRQDPEIGHKSVTVETWHADDAVPLRQHFDTDIAGLEWAEIQNARRRERRARRQQAA